MVEKGERAFGQWEQHVQRPGGESVLGISGDSVHRLWAMGVGESMKVGSRR